MNKIRLLIAEDSGFNKLLLEQLIISLGFDYKFVNNGQEAIDDFKINDYSLILMDIEMPVLDGIQATKIIRTEFDNDKRTIPIVALTAHRNEELFATLRKQGFTDILTKPITADIIEQKVKTILQKKENAESKKSYDLKYLEEYAEGDKDFIIQMLQFFISDTPEFINSMKYSYSQADWESLKKKAHKFAPHLNFIGLNELHSNMKHIEQLAEKKANTTEIIALIEKIEKETGAVIEKLKTDFCL